MKCAYKQELAKQRQARDEEGLIEQEHKARANLFALALLTAKDQFGFNNEQLKKMLDGMFEEAGDAFDHYRDESEEDYDPNTVPFLLQGFINQLDALEVDVRDIEKSHVFTLPDTTYWSEKRKASLAGRLDVLKDREVSFRAYMYSFMLYLYHEYEYEGEKLTAYYNEVLDWYYKTWDMYLLCNYTQDSFLKYQVDGRILKVKIQHGIDLDWATDVKEKETEKEKGDKADDENTNESQEV